MASPLQAHSKGKSQRRRSCRCAPSEPGGNGQDTAGPQTGMLGTDFKLCKWATEMKTDLPLGKELTTGSLPERQLKRLWLLFSLETPLFHISGRKTDKRSNTETWTVGRS